jgi:hypothetical protein
MPYRSRTSLGQLGKKEGNENIHGALSHVLPTGIGRSRTIIGQLEKKNENIHGDYVLLASQSPTRVTMCNFYYFESYLYYC